MRKKLVASRQLSTDHKLERDDVAIKAPGDGLAPYHLEDIIGKRTTREFMTDENLTLEALT